MEIRTKEHSNFLPEVVNRIVLRLLKIRADTFLNAPKRRKKDYFPWKGWNGHDDHPTMCYPSLPLFRYPKKYKVSGVTDSDLCDKDFSSHNDFSHGISTAGCCCPYNITFGFELMLTKESWSNFFRFLMCRDVDFHTLEGILYDFACGEDPYCLNREPLEFEWIRMLVDGSHWSAQKKLKRPDISGKGGQLGCSDSFNYKIYKPVLDTGYRTNPQGWEEMHAQIDACSKSLRLMSYEHYMHL